MIRTSSEAKLDVIDLTRDNNNNVIDLTDSVIDLTGDKLTVSGTASNGIAPKVNASKRRKPQEPQLINWVFTVYPHAIIDGVDPDTAKSVSEQKVTTFAHGWCKYLIFGREICPKTGNFHLQGCCVLNNRMRMTELMKLIHSTVHWEPMDKPLQYNIDYCMKDGDFMEFGERPVDNGKREQQRWALARQQVTTEGVHAVEDAQIYIGQFSNLVKIQNHFLKALQDLPDVCGFWLYGVSNAGKSWMARNRWLDGGVYLKPPNKWFDNYNKEATVVIEDLDKSHAYMLGYLKNWADKYPFPAETKGGTFQIRPQRIVVTSNHSISDIFNAAKERDNVNANDLVALKRRFKVIRFVFPYNGVGTAAPIEETFEPDPPRLTRSETVFLQPPVARCDTPPPPGARRNYPLSIGAAKGEYLDATESEGEEEF